MIRPFFAFATGLVLALLATSLALGRIDRAQLAAATARSEIRLLRAQMEQREAARYMSPEQTFDARPSLQLLGVRTEVLRRTIETLILAGTRWSSDFRSFPSLGDALWPAWPERGWDLAVEPMRIRGGEPVEARR